MNWEWSVAKDVGLLALAVYGAALSTFNWRQATRRDTRSLQIRVSSVMPTYGPDLGPPWAHIEAVNSGARPVTVNVLSFALPDGRRMFTMGAGGFPGMTSTPLPASLADGATASTLISYGDLAAALRSAGHSGIMELLPVAEDSLGNTHRGQPFEVDISAFERMSA